MKRTVHLFDKPSASFTVTTSDYYFDYGSTKTRLWTDGDKLFHIRKDDEFGGWYADEFNGYMHCSHGRPMSEW